MAAVWPDAPTHQDLGIDFVGNDTCKALRMRAYYEATDRLGVLVRLSGRETGLPKTAD